MCIYSVDIYTNDRHCDSACKYTYNEIFDDIYNNIGIIWVHSTHNIGMSFVMSGEYAYPSYIGKRCIVNLIYFVKCS